MSAWPILASPEWQRYSASKRNMEHELNSNTFIEALPNKYFGDAVNHPGRTAPLVNSRSRERHSPFRRTECSPGETNAEPSWRPDQHRDPLVDSHTDQRRTDLSERYVPTGPAEARRCHALRESIRATEAQPRRGWWAASEDSRESRAGSARSRRVVPDPRRLRPASSVVSPG
jgi:hypothetical protein